MNFLKDGLSIKEAKVSVLVVCLLTTLAYSLYSHYQTGEITDNLYQLLQMLILAVVGFNIADVSTNLFRKKEGETYDR